MRCQSAGQNSGSGADAVSPSLSPLSPGFSEWPPALPSQSLQLLGMSPKPLTSEDARFLRLFSAEVGQWMDLSDLSQTFSRKICRLAMHDPLLKAAIIACAAKQQYLTGRLFDGMLIARKNYNTAISLLIDRLQESEQPFAGFGFAATVICSCYEMLDATGRDWQKHLDGVFSFSQVRSVNGSSGGIEQAGFWSIARQEVVCSIINKSRLRLDPDLWAVDLVRIGQEGCEDLMNNQILTILAKVANAIAHWEADKPRKLRAVDEWKSLWDLLNHWERSVTAKGFMDPVLYKEDGQLFTTIWFTRGVCASSWQMFHLTRILLLSIDPSQTLDCVAAFRNIEGKLQYHARQICGIAQSKPEGSCRVNSVQPLHYAGCCFSNTDERNAVALLLESIEEDLGWAAKYRANDLYRQWGWRRDF
ncbi:uncharacterized protein ACHE_70168S [Aspergillus chevalieri]|uniref:Zn(II)2Cys6 transcription factor n=1 Tax=Aspergillus chevalieri TaxID=182096 RepID=A0A7R7ZQS4_ASPCH|nr:uncharacterized protein ACHE_70168S [Aspergillus chevalieri]BCR91325.1 hypothetical protein ACHE_70168S [Aspergillus chevalieri]